MRTVITRILIITIYIIVFSGCQNDSKTTTDSLDINLEEDILEAKKSTTVKTTYKLPSPVETFIFMKDNGSQFYPEFLNPIEQYDNYITSFDRALNFGVYASDMVYSTINGDYEKTIYYFRATKNLASSLGIHDGFGQLIANRIDKNLYNIDSLFEITSDSYWEACTYLEGEGKSDYLALILTGGWIESVFIMSNSIQTIDQNDPVLIRFTEQQVLLDNLIDFLTSLELNEDIQPVLINLNELQILFYSLFDNPENIYITEKQFKTITNKIKETRNHIVTI